MLVISKMEQRDLADLRGFELIRTENHLLQSNYSGVERSGKENSGVLVTELLVVTDNFICFSDIVHKGRVKQVGSLQLFFGRHTVSGVA